ncbi:MAG: hypothetical protein K8S16_22060, partial [Bacteroidales bacterium]|nr:hypothetical protein [Bacteroidales bacterium]
MVKSIYFLVLILLTFSFLDLNAQIRSESLENIPEPDKIEDTKPLFPKDTSLCVPQYSTGCSMGDGFTDFAVEEIQNYGSGCADNTGYDGWSQYLEMGPAFLIPGQSYDFIMQTGYDDQSVSIWVDFNDDFILTPDETILFDFDLTESGQFYTANVTIPLEAIPGMHIMRARAKWTGTCDDPCDNYSYGEAEDYYVVIGEAAFGTLEGTVTEFTGGAPIWGAEILLEGLIDYTFTSGPDGYYMN